MKDDIEKCVHSLSHFLLSRRPEDVSESYFVAHVYPQDSLCADCAMHWIALHLYSWVHFHGLRKRILDSFPLHDVTMSLSDLSL